MANEILTHEDALIQTLSKNVGGFSIRIDTDKPTDNNNLYVIQATEGVQPFRLQYEAAISGEGYVVGGGQGVGDFVFNVLEGPVCNDEEDSSILSKCCASQHISKRKITVTQGSGRAAKCFLGYIVAIKTSTIENNGIIFISGQIRARGRWQ